VKATATPSTIPAPTTAPPVLSVRDLTAVFATRAGTVTAVDAVSFDVAAGECLGIVGESGSGKSVACLAIMGLIDYPGRVAGGEILFRGQDLRAATPEHLRALRGASIGMVFQDPQTALNPLFTVGAQMTDVVRAHRRCSRGEAEKLAVEKLRLVGVSSPEQRLRAYPWELSGGLRQRVAIAMALLLDPALLIADEPTTALDVSIQAQIIDLLDDLKRRLGFAMIFISHDLGVVSNVADRVLVMYAGKAVELGPAPAALGTPAHPYTAALVASAPTLESERGVPLPAIEGSLPGLANLPAGCVFAPRCPRAQPRCAADRPMLGPLPGLPGRSAACWFPIVPGGAGEEAARG
jgi:oligopeptide/dipeptide ABC transporter ATP-binding protein